MDTATLRPFRWGALFLLISAILHVVVWALSGFSSEFSSLLPLALAYAVLGIALMSLGWRLLAYVVFFVAALGGSFALSFFFAPSSVAPLWFQAIVAANWLCAACLIVGLWRSPIDVEKSNRQAN